MGVACSSAVGPDLYGEQCVALRTTTERTPSYRKAGVPINPAHQVPSPALASALASTSCVLRRWDGKVGTPKELMSNLAEHLAKYTDPSCEGFRSTGTAQGIAYEIHDELSAMAPSGDAYFRLSGTLAMPARLMLALLMDAGKMGAIDPTVCNLSFLHAFRDEQAPPSAGQRFLAYWCAMPAASPSGVPFQWREGMDISGWWPSTETAASAEANGQQVYYQGSVTVLEVSGADCLENGGSPLQPSGRVMHAVDMYWGYRLTERLDAATGQPCVDARLVCQTALGGCLPVGLKNAQVCKVLADYMRSLEALGKELIENGRADAFMANHPGLG